MIARIILTTMLAGTVLAASAQQQYIDSLKKIVDTEKDPATISCLYYQMAATAFDVDISRSIDYSEQAVEAALKSKQDSLIVKAYILQVSAYMYGGRIDDALQPARKAVQLATSAGNYTSLYHAEKSLANIFRRLAKYDSCLVHNMNTLKIAEEHLNDTFVAGAYNSLGAFYTTVGQLDRSEGYYLKALQLRTKMKDSLSMAYSYNNLGIINRERGNYPKALEYYNKAKDIYITINDSSEIAFIYNDIGAAYSKSGLLDSGEHYLKESIRLREQLNELNELAYTYNYLGENYERKLDLKKAEEYIKKALALAISIHNNKQHYEALESLSDFYARNRMYDSAYSYLQQYRLFRDSIRRLDNEKLIEELNTKYETEKKEKVIQEQEFELTRKNYLLAGSIMLLASIVLVSFSSYRRYKTKQRVVLQEAIMKQQELATKAIIEAEENERQRIAGDLHDGVGQMMSAAKINLSMLSADISFHDEEQRLRFINALKLVDDSCNEVRTVSHNIMPNALLRNSLASAVRTFIDQIDQQFIKINLYAEGLNEKIAEDVEIILYRIIQECVNNVIKHAGANRLDISLIKDEHEITVTIEDNGKGFEARQAEGMGMRNIRKRVGYLKGNVEWDSNPGRGTVVSIHIPA